MIPHGHCYLWQPDLVRLHVISDGLTAASYYSIPLVLSIFAAKRRDVPFTGVFWLFAVFIFACGTTHLMAIWTVWHPDYWVEGVLKAITALVSIWTALTLTVTIQQALQLPRLVDIEQVNQELRVEIESRKETEAALKESEANFRNMAANVPGAIFRYILRPDGTEAVLYMSPGCYQLWEIEAHRIEQDASLLWSVVDPEDLPAMQTSLMESAQTLDTWNCEWRITIPSGQRKWLQGIGRPIQQSDGAVLWHAVIMDVSERKRAELQLQDLYNRLELATRSARIGIWEWDVVNNHIIWDDRMYELYGLHPGAFGGAYEAWETGVYPEDQIASRTAIQQALKGEKDFDTEFRVLWPDGTVRHIEAHAMVQRDMKERPLRMTGVNWDITERKQAELALEQELLLSKTLFDTSIDGIVLLNQQGDVLQASTSFAQMLGYTLAETRRLNVTDWDAQWNREELQAMLRGTVPLPPRFETRHRRKDGSLYDVEISYSQEVLNGEVIHFCICRDISDRKQAEEQLLYSALHDTLTDLPNRTLLTNRLELAIQRSQRSQTYHFAVLFLDLDQFKVINDSLGHLIGDELLLAIAQKLQRIIRPTDIAARLGGDEFVILLEHIPNITSVIHMAERLLAEFNDATVVDNHSVFITTSIGIVWGSPAYTEATDLLRDADIALYRAKSQGRSRYAIFDVDMHTQAVKRMRLEHDLRVALERQEFVPYYQPIFDLKNQRLMGFEALIRWQHPMQGFISPADFIPVAEETGLIMPISRWILQSACEQVAGWRRQFPDMEDLKVSVNLSGQDLRQPTLVDTIRQILDRAQLPATTLTIEITESMLIENIETTIDLLRQFRDLGIHISIDDFGTGYSSLSYLYNLPGDYLKIDKAFVSNMQPGDKNYKIVQAVVSLSDQLELAAIAEGIETIQQLEWLKAMNCELGQGYLLSRPLTSTQAAALLENGRIIELPLT